MVCTWSYWISWDVASISSTFMRKYTGILFLKTIVYISQRSFFSSFLFFFLRNTFWMRKHSKSDRLYIVNWGRSIEDYGRNTWQSNNKFLAAEKEQKRISTVWNISRWETSPALEFWIVQCYTIFTLRKIYTAQINQFKMKKNECFHQWQ